MIRSPLVALALVLPMLASAQESASYSIDAELVRPTFGYESLSAVDIPTTRKQFAVRGGGMLMYTRDPVTLYDRLAGEEIGAVVADRFTLMLGASVDLSERFTLHALVPAAVNGPGEDGDPKIYEAPGVGLSDIGVGGRVIAIRSKHFNLGVRAGLIFPTSTRFAYLGDSGFRPNGGLLASVHVGRTVVGTDLGVMGRPEVLATQEDFVYGTELNWNTGFRHKLPDATRLGFTGQFLARSGFSNFLAGGAETSLEGLAGVQVYPSRNVTLDVSAGRGFTQGYATTDLRVLTGLTVQFAPKEPVVLPPPPPPPRVEPPPPEIIVDEPEPIFEDEVLILTETQIEIKDPIEFVVGTTTLREDTRYVLQAVADLMNENGALAHVVIEGHASVEGSFEYNYGLSQGRARTIWQELVQAGVHPDRISYRGMGEVVPRPGAKGDSEEDLQDNRRVEFDVIKQLGELDEWPSYPASIKAPWNGEPVKITTPIKPQPEPEKNLIEGDGFETDDKGFEDFEMAPEGTPAPDGGAPGEK